MNIIKIAFFDAKTYDKLWFEKLKPENMKIKYFESKLNEDTASLANGYDVVVAFVNDDINANTIQILHDANVKLIAMRCAGYNNIDFKAAYGKINVVRVPGYSPYAVAEHAMALLLCLNRKIHKSYTRTREHNFSIVGLEGFDLNGKTAGVIGTGKIGQVFIDICKGFGMNVIAYDPYPAKGKNINYVTLDQLFTDSDIVSLHCPLTDSTKYTINSNNLKLMKPNAVIINTSRGALIDSSALLDALQEGRIGGAGLDVYEEESDFFFEDVSTEIMKDEILSLLISLPNVLITSHQAFLTDEALSNIADTTFNNIEDFFADRPLKNEICYQCLKDGGNAKCRKPGINKCF